MIRAKLFFFFFFFREGGGWLFYFGLVIFFFFVSDFAMLGSFITPFSSVNSNVAAGKLFGIPLRGTHSHAFVSSYMVCNQFIEFCYLFG